MGILDRLLTAFRRAADQVPAYRTLLEEAEVRVDDIVDLASFSRLCPLLTKQGTFGRFRLSDMSVGIPVRDVATVMTSSGHGGRFSFGVINREEAAAEAAFIDAAMDAAFAVASRTTLAINCLPMGVVLSSHCMTVATTSVREDMAVAVVEAVGERYDQLLLVGDPLFMKRLVDHAAAVALDWRRFRVNAVIGEEIFGEHFRTYLGARLGLSPDRPHDGYIMSSFGVGELGLHLCFETPATIAIRRAAATEPALARDLLGAGTGMGLTLPMILSADPHRAFIEVVAPDADGYGAMTVSMLDPHRSVPLLRYQTGDVARLLDRHQVVASLHRHGVTIPADLPETCLALRGRHREVLPNGSHVGFYKDALYADQEMAARLTGAFRLVVSGAHCTMHVQLVRGQEPDAGDVDRLSRAITSAVRPVCPVFWSYERFPFGMTIDYNRKFSHYVPGDAEPGRSDG